MSTLRDDADAALVSFSYDARGRRLSSLTPTERPLTASFTYDALGRQLTQTLPIASVSNPVFTSEWDLAGRRTRYTWPVDASGPTAYYVDYDHLVTGEVSAIREKGATSGAGVLATFGYDDLGRRASLTRGNGAVTSYAYDPASRLGSMTHDFAGTAHDLTLGFGYTPASQLASSTRSNDLYSWNGHGIGTTSSSTNGLNQLATHGGATPTHDARGNLTSDGTFSYTYSSENLMTSGANSGTLGYDPLMRFYRSGSTYFVHEGGLLVGDYFNGSIVNRFVPGPGTDEPLVQVDKFGARTWYHSDERGSVIAGSDSTGANARIVTYDEYGKRGSGGSYRIAYTGQVHLINDLYDYKARNYNARLGRFVQTDPIGYGDGMNMYGYVGGDPVNSTDPTGMEEEGTVEDIIVTGHREEPRPVLTGSASLMGANRTRGPVPNDDLDRDGQPDPDIVVTGTPPQEVIKIIFTGSDFACQFVGGRQFTVFAQNLQPNFDGVEISGQSFGMDDNGNVYRVFQCQGGNGSARVGTSAPFETRHSILEQAAPRTATRRFTGLSYEGPSGAVALLR